MARVNDIRYVGYAVPDLEAEIVFYTDQWKLRLVERNETIALFAAEGGTQTYCVRLRKSDVKRIDVISWSAPDRASVDELAVQVKGAGGRLISEPSALSIPGGGYGFRFFDPSGFTIEVSCDFDRKEPRQLAPGEPVPEKISHVVLHSPTHKAYVQFYEQALGFRVSDWLGDFMCFLRCNEWHHRLAILPGPPCFNHVAYDVPGVDAVMKGIRRLKTSGSDIAWGPGRHTAGNNIFSYFLTPGGNVVEYTSDLERVDDATWQATVHQPSESVMDQWGVGVGGPATMPHPHPDPCLFQAPEV